MFKHFDVEHYQRESEVRNITITEKDKVQNYSIRNQNAEEINIELKISLFNKILGMYLNFDECIRLILSSFM